MRQARLRAPDYHPVGYYHCLSRVVDRQFIFRDAEREQFLRLLRQYEAFGHLRILTYCLMSNHFHVLVAVPRRPESPPPAETLFAHAESVAGLPGITDLRERWQRLQEHGDHSAAQAMLEAIHQRMYDLSFLMKMVKQRFSAWYNRRTGRKGTLWEERFRSVVVEGTGRSLVTMAAYIDLNPVRAGLASDPKEYRWCGYAEAVAGTTTAQAGLGEIVRALLGGETVSHAAGILESYRMHLYATGDEERCGIGENGQPLRKGLSHKEVVQVLNAKGKLSDIEYLRCRVRYFCDGAVLGSRDFVERLFVENRHRFGPQRTSGARKLRGLLVDGLYCFRDLRVRVFG